MKLFQGKKKGKTSKSLKPDGVPAPIEKGQGKVQEIGSDYSLMNMIGRAINEKDFPLEKLQILLKMKDDYEKGVAKKAFIRAMAAFKKNPPKIFKLKKADFGPGKAKYNYAPLSEVATKIGMALAPHGLSHRWQTIQDGNVITVHCFLTHELGHTEMATLIGAKDTSGGKNDIQGVGSTRSYLQRYTLETVTGCAATDPNDDDGHGAGQPQGEEPKAPKKFNWTIKRSDFVIPEGPLKDKIAKDLTINQLVWLRPQVEEPKWIELYIEQRLEELHDNSAEKISDWESMTVEHKIVALTQLRVAGK